ncbi:Cellulase [Heracleum sosnowskyi]|uniref:cellulase n=1 Tax=Heracleum sosnowskyi TaxID=360622 RepID=A0AAD8MIN8_9APIA|nr:Cellulase [Heracleum sosnowskyi]
MNSEIDMVGVIEQDHTSEDQRTLDEIQRGWLLNPETDLSRKKSKPINLGCIICSRKAFKWTVGLVILAILVIGLPTIRTKSLPEHHPQTRQLDNYTAALHDALLFFNEQKSGRLPKENYNISWRADSGLQDGNFTERGLIGGYYDAGDNTKYHFPMAFVMTMLSWSVLEYEGKYKNREEYEHVLELIKWGTDYLLLTFDSFASSIPCIYS